MESIFFFFFCQFTSEQLYIGAPLLQGKEALARVIGEDFRLQKTLLMVHPRKQFAYYHEYVKSAMKDIYIIRVCNQRIKKKSFEDYRTKLELDFPYLYVVVDFTGDVPLFRIENWKEMSKSTEEVVRVLTYSLNIVLEGYGWQLRLEPSKQKPQNSKLLNVMRKKYLNMPRTMDELYGEEFIEKLMPTMNERPHKSTNDFRKTIIAEDIADDVIALLHKLIDDKEGPQSIMRPIHAAIVAGVISKITLKQFRSEFGDIMDKSSSSFNKYTNMKRHDFDNDTMHDIIVEEFQNLLLRKSSKKGGF